MLTSLPLIPSSFLPVPYEQFRVPVRGHTYIRTTYIHRYLRTHTNAEHADAQVDYWAHCM